MRSAIGVLIIGALITPAQAQSTGNELLSKCEAFLDSYHSLGPTTFQLRGDATDGFQCFGYVSAISAFAYLNLNGRRAIEHLCLPNGTTTVQLIRVLVNYGHQHPEILHGDAMPLALNSISLAFPCDND
jgi:hypothetical protein